MSYFIKYIFFFVTVKGYCGWSNEEAADFDWMLGRGATTDDFTGPSSDHTLQTAAGTYLFIDASPPRLPGQKAVLVSEMMAPGEISCLEFWYHMWGQVRTEEMAGDNGITRPCQWSGHVRAKEISSLERAGRPCHWLQAGWLAGWHRLDAFLYNPPFGLFLQGCGTLEVELRVNGSAPKTLWSLSGEKMDRWNYGSVDVTSGALYGVSGEADGTPQPFQVAFIVTRGSNHLGDIALDDIESKMTTCTTVPKEAIPSATVRKLFTGFPTRAIIPSVFSIYSCFYI